MSFLNVEIKARLRNSTFINQYLAAKEARFVGIDTQTDTYFKVAFGRLKLREGTIENNLIFYTRANQAGPKSSHFQLLKINEPEQLKQILTDANGIKVVVVKKRSIYFIENVKFHIDEVEHLGSFVEIEASNLYADVDATTLKNQCDFYKKELEIKDEDLIQNSYSDMMLQR